MQRYLYCVIAHIDKISVCNCSRYNTHSATPSLPMRYFTTTIARCCNSSPLSITSAHQSFWKMCKRVLPLTSIWLKLLQRTRFELYRYFSKFQTGHLIKIKKYIFNLTISNCERNKHVHVFLQNKIMARNSFKTTKHVFGLKKSHFKKQAWLISKLMLIE